MNCSRDLDIHCLPGAADLPPVHTILQRTDYQGLQQHMRVRVWGLGLHLKGTMGVSRSSRMEVHCWAKVPFSIVSSTLCMAARTPALLWSSPTLTPQGRQTLNVYEKRMRTWYMSEA